MHYKKDDPKSPFLGTDSIPSEIQFIDRAFHIVTQVEFSTNPAFRTSTVLGVAYACALRTAVDLRHQEHRLNTTFFIYSDSLAANIVILLKPIPQKRLEAEEAATDFIDRFRHNMSSHLKVKVDVNFEPEDINPIPDPFS